MPVQLCTRKILQQKQTQQKVQEQSFWFAFLTDRRLTSPTPCLYLQGEGELQVGLRQPRRGQQDLVGAQDPLGALRRRRKERHKRRERREWKMERLPLACPGRLQRGQNNELSSTACSEGSVGAKEVGGKLTDRSEDCGRGSSSLEDEQKRLKVRYVPETAENLLVYLDWKTRWR